MGQEIDNIKQPTFTFELETSVTAFFNDAVLELPLRGVSLATDFAMATPPTILVSDLDFLLFRNFAFRSFISAGVTSPVDVLSSN